MPGEDESGPFEWVAMSEKPSPEAPRTRIPCDRFNLPVDPASRVRSWTEQLSPVFEAHLAHNTEFSSTVGMMTYHFGDVLLGTVSAPAQRLERSVRKIARQGVDHILIQFYTQGEARVELGRRSTTVKPRQMVVFDLSQPVVTEAKAVSATNIMVPRTLLADHVATIETLHGQPLDSESEPLRRLFATYLTGLLACAETVDAQQARFLSQAAAKHCGACFQPGDGTARATEQLLGLGIRQFIETELASESLGVDAISARFGISRATLYRLFELDGGVARYIRERRLLRAMRLLTAPGGRPRVSSVAYATGFSDEKTFSRAFNRHFGFLPREAWKGNALPRSGNENDLTLFAWMKTLAA